MTVLTNAERIDSWAEFMRDQSRKRLPLGLTKAELRAAVDAIDDWIEANASAFNTAIPQPARSALDTDQKTALFTYVLNRRRARAAA
jgi:dTDP-4-dehydrorhamnose reductase